MNPFSVTDLIVVLFLSLVAGYLVLSLLIPDRVWKTLRRRRGPDPSRDVGPTPNRPPGGRSRAPADDPPTAPTHHVVTEREHAEILGLSGRVTPYQIKLAYRHEIAKYHPDKVNHLAPEFQELARERTRRIRAAYEYLRNRYGS